MTRSPLLLEAVVPFAILSSLGFDSSPLRILLSGKSDEQASALLRVGRAPASETDVVDATGELVSRVALVLSQWELRCRADDAVVAGSTMSPIALRPFAPFPCVVRVFAGGAPTAPA